MKNITKIVGIIMASAVIFTGCGSSASTSSTAVSIKTSSSSSAESVDTGTRTKNTYDEGTKEYIFDGLKVNVPTEFGDSSPDSDDYKTWNITSSNNVLHMEASYTDTDISDDKIISEIIDDMMPYADESDASSIVSNPEPTNVKTFTVGDFEAVSFQVDIPGDPEWDDYDYIRAYTTYVVNTTSEKLDLIVLAEKNIARYSYKNDYDKIIESMTTE